MVFVPIVGVFTDILASTLFQGSGVTDGRHKRGDGIPMYSRCGFVRNSAFVALALVILALFTAGSFAAEPAAPANALEAKLQVLVNDLRSRLSLSVPVVVSVVPKNSLMMSVEAPENRDGVFSLMIDAAFLDTLSDAELEAGIAHELGHVWIFTHHPYLQTEELANQIAMRAVSRESLQSVYVKVSQQGDVKGDLVRFLSNVPTEALAPETSSR